MSLDPLRQSQFRADAVINASGGVPNHAPAPTGIGNNDSTLGTEGSSDGSCSLIGKRFLALKDMLGDLCLRIKEWVKSWFVPASPRNTSTPVNTSQPDPQPNPPVNDPLPNNPPEPNPPPVNNPPPNNPPELNPPPVNNPPPNNPPELNPPPVNNPPPNPVNNLQPTPELILQTFGDEIRVVLEIIPAIFRAFGYVRDLGEVIPRPPAEVRARLVAIYDSFPMMVRIYIENKMEELKREANPEVELVPNWAFRIIRNEIQYPNEVVPIAVPGETNILDTNHVFNQAVHDLFRQLGGQPDPIPMTLRIFRSITDYFIFRLFAADAADAARYFIGEARPRIADNFTELPPEIQDQIKDKMVRFAEVENPEVREIPNWAERAIHGDPDWERRVFLGEVPLLGEPDDRWFIGRHMNIFAPDGPFVRAVIDTLNEAPVPQPAQV